MGRPGDVTPSYDGPAVGLAGVTIRRGAVTLVSDVDWTADWGQQWVVFGRNGAGKTTVLQVAGGALFPTAGIATVCGHRMGTVDLRSLRKHVGLVTTRQRLPDEEGLTVEAAVLSGHTGTVLPLWRYYDERVRTAAREWLELVGCAELAARAVRDCSQGERARVRLARALLADPAVLLLDEPFAGLDLPGREDLLLALEGLVRTRPTMTTVLVTHHVEEVPATTTHALMLRGGRVVTAGAMATAFTGPMLSRCLGRDIELVAVGSRWTAHAAAPDRSAV